MRWRLVAASVDRLQLARAANLAYSYFSMAVATDAKDFFDDIEQSVTYVQQGGNIALLKTSLNMVVTGACSCGGGHRRIAGCGFLLLLSRVCVLNMTVALR